MRAIRVTWREELTRQDVEALQANIRRVGLVIKLRWALVAVLTLYSIVGGLLYSAHIPAGQLRQLMAVPAAALAFVVLYNTFYQLTYRRFGNLAVFNNVQLALDVLVVTLLVYYSGGPASWFWTVISLFILESAFIMQRPADTWGLAAFASVLLAIVIAAEFWGLLPHQEIPFSRAELNNDATYVLVRYLWQVTVLAGTASIAIIGTRALTADESAETLIDPVTSLYSRSFFRRALNSEVSRARRSRRALHVLLLDIDRFGEFNRRFGIDTGDEMLKCASKAVLDTLEVVGGIEITGNVASRYGGEEFAILFVEDLPTDSAPDAAAAHRLAENLRTALGACRVNDAGITVSVGVASFPTDGESPEELIEAADEALILAIEAGGDCVSVAAHPVVPVGA
ncbi:MAG: GGDEF domain-containing protein [Coriobacteriales bacterium]|nr:GGDEF domain-containing protein [Coriobacteriales bacterium]